MGVDREVAAAAAMSPLPSEASAALLRELVAHLRQNRTQLREEWAARITEAQLLTAMTKDEIFTEATSVYDNYVEVEYDLSRVMFVSTANSLSTIHPALRDRMEIIEVNGYTQEEKIEIAMRHLLPKQFAENGIKPKQLKLGPGLLEAIIDQYTDESGVRTLEKRIAKLVRYRAKQIALKQKHGLTITVDDDGPGIPPAMREEVFKPFLRLDDARNQDEGGTGLGLAIARDIARSHGGDITLGESPMGGLRATVRVPV